MAEDGVVIMMSVVGTLGGEMDPLAYEEVYSYWDDYFTTTYFLNDPPITFNSTPHQIVIDLETMIVLGKGNSSGISVDQMVDLVEQAAAD
jgi:hypothetical protein